MSSRALVRSHEHLARNRRLILGHTVVATLGGLVPLPYLSDWLPALVRRDLVRRIAESRGVDLDQAALRMIAEGEVREPGWRSLISAAPLIRFARRSLRVAWVGWSVYRQGESSARSFAIATLFDHYCARLHVGGELGIDAARALRLRMEAAVQSPAGGVARWALTRAFSGALEAARRAPAQLLAALSAKPDRGDLVEAEEIAGEALAQVDDSSTVLGHTTGTVERRLAGSGTSFVDGLVDAFERSGG